jgi:hypothetical protein
MTESQACSIIGVSMHSSLYEIEQAYTNKLQSLQLQLVTGQPLAVRQQGNRKVERR